MLEERINVLIQSIDCLTAVINRLWDQKDGIKGVPAPEISAEPPKVEIDPAALENLCLSIVRKNKKKAKNIKATIKKFGGELIKDVPSDKLPELQTALEKLAA